MVQRYIHFFNHIQYICIYWITPEFQRINVLKTSVVGELFSHSKELFKIHQCNEKYRIFFL